VGLLEQRLKRSCVPRSKRSSTRRFRSFRLDILMVIATLVSAISTEIPGELRAQSQEYQVKAAFLFHFAQFIEWPPEAFKQADAPMMYCTIGDDPFQGGLDASLNGKTIGTRQVRVRHLRQAGEIPGCQVLFIGSAEKKSIAAALANANGAATLTVGDSEHFAQEGGMIGFSLEDNKIRFEINLDAAEHAKLKISARLLALAKTVIGGPKGI
jgi:hypothetical protein